MRGVKPWQAFAGGALLGGAVLGVVALTSRSRPRPFPRGKGVFVRSLINDTPTPASMVAVAEDLGLQWVALAGEDRSNQVASIYRDRLPAYVAALQRAGVQVWLWGWPQSPDDAEVDWFVQQLGGLAEQLDVAGVIVNAERPFYNVGRSKPDPVDVAAAERLVAGLQKYGKPIGLTSYGSGPPWHPAFAWQGFEGVDFGVPQIYDSKHRLPRDFPTVAVRNWQAAGFARNVPLLGASFNHTAEQMVDMLARVPVPDGALGWWTLDHALNSRSRTDVLREYKIGAVA